MEKDVTAVADRSEIDAMIVNLYHQRDVSIDEVASSRINTGGSATAALAIEINCLCP